ncbi:MAG: BrnT family toxin [Vicinamibacterales bacterium]|jgi:uncharacterized DUF497 family protein|nr:BrnT family toxin [Vicinamibacterales bacterium]
MDDLRFEWDPAKAVINQRKHGVAFEEAQTAFLDDSALIVDDPRIISARRATKSERATYVMRLPR